MPEIMDYDPNLTNSGNVATQLVRLTFGMWKYRAVIEVPVGGNCTGLTVIDCAVSNAYDGLEQRGIMGSKKTYAVLNMPSLEDPEDFLECDEDESHNGHLRGEDWLKDMLVAAEIVSITPA